MESLREKIDQRIDLLQQMMEANHHIKNPTRVYDLTLEISKFWSVLSEEDRDYVQCAQHAIEEEMEWRL